MVGMLVTGVHLTIALISMLSSIGVATSKSLSKGHRVISFLFFLFLHYMSSVVDQEFAFHTLHLNATVITGSTLS